MTNRRPRARRRLHTRRRRPGARRAAHDQPSGKQVIAEMEDRERAAPASDPSRSLQRVFGYYIEISKSHLRAVPSDYQRKQTNRGGGALHHAGTEDYEEKVLGADERILECELEIFEKLRTAVAAEAPRIQASARALAALDVLAFARRVRRVQQLHQAARARGRRTDGPRRPPSVVEQRLSSGSGFVPNDIALNGTTCQLVILTGPNMGGKSTYFGRPRSCCLMAQAARSCRARSEDLAAIRRLRPCRRVDNIARGIRRSWWRCRRRRTSSNRLSARPRGPGRDRPGHRHVHA